MSLVRNNEWKCRAGSSTPCFWVSGHCPGAPAPVSDHDGMDAKPTTREPGQSWTPISVPTLEDTHLRGFRLVYKHVKMRLGRGFESCSCPAESKALTQPTQALPVGWNHDSLREDAHTHHRKNHLSSGWRRLLHHLPSFCMWVIQDRALSAQRHCLRGRIRQNLHSFFTFSTPAKPELTRKESMEGKRRSRSPVQVRRSWDTAAASTRRRPIVPTLSVGKGLQIARTTIFHRRSRGSWLVPSGRQEEMERKRIWAFPIFCFVSFSSSSSSCGHSTYQGKKPVWTASTSKYMLSHHKRCRWLFFLTIRTSSSTTILSLYKPLGKSGEKNNLKLKLEKNPKTLDQILRTRKSYSFSLEAEVWGEKNPNKITIVDSLNLFRKMKGKAYVWAKKEQKIKDWERRSDSRRQERRGNWKTRMEMERKFKRRPGHNINLAENWGLWK